MKKAILYVIALMLITGCDQTLTHEQQSVGYLNLTGIGVQVDGDIQPLKSSHSNDDHSGYPAQAIGQMVDPLQVIITDSHGQIIKQYDSHLMMPSTTPLPTGSYRITAQSLGEISGARFDSPYYRAYKDFTITPPEITHIELVCKETTCSVLVEYDDLFKSVFPDTNYRYYSILRSSNGESIQVAGDETRKAYFNLTTPDVMMYCQIFMSRKTDSGEWMPIWGSDEGLKEVIFTVNTEIGLLPNTLYRVKVKI